MKNNIIKKIAATAMLVFMVCGMANAQIFVLDDDEELSPRTGATGDANNEWLVVPDQGVTIDQYDYTPVGGGVLLLAGLAGAYALAKRRKK